MVDGNTLIKVQNRDFGTVSYIIPDLNNLYREFQPNEIKNITFDELFKLSQVPGGMYIIENYLIIYSENAVEELMGAVEPEYFYSDKQVIELMKNGSLDEFEDCLNFAPKGVLDLIKDLAVKLPLNDVAKRDLILKKLNFNVANAIEISKVDEVEEVETVKRKAAVPKLNNTGNTVVRKTVVPKKKVTHDAE